VSARSAFVAPVQRRSSSRRVGAIDSRLGRPRIDDSNVALVGITGLDGLTSRVLKKS
jgi:hypothetical protein